MNSKMEISEDPTMLSDFTQIFCECYEQYVKCINMLNLGMKNQLPVEISPYKFHSTHDQYKEKVLASDPSVLLDIPYINRRRCLSLSDSSKMALLNFLKNLYEFAKLATTEPDRLSNEERQLGESILQAHNEQNADRRNFLANLFTDVRKELDEKFAGEDTRQALIDELQQYGGKSKLQSDPVGVISDLIGRSENIGKEGAPASVFLEIVAKISEKATSKMKEKNINEQELMMQSLALLNGFQLARERP